MIRSLFLIKKIKYFVFLFGITIHLPCSFAKGFPKSLYPLDGMVVGPGTYSLSQPILKTFSSDGCSQSPHQIYDVNFVNCCIEHDVYYWLGGTLAEKATADEQLRQCIKDELNKSKNPVVRALAGKIAKTYQIGVILGGGYFPIANSYRWGYGWNFNRGYSSITREERQQSEALYGPHLEILWSLVHEKKFEFQKQCFTIDNLHYIPEDIYIYYYFRNHLKTKVVISSVNKVFVDGKKIIYKVNTKDLNGNIVRYKFIFSTKNIVHDFFRSTDSFINYIEQNPDFVDKNIREITTSTDEPDTQNL